MKPIKTALENRSLRNMAQALSGGAVSVSYQTVANWSNGGAVDPAPFYRIILVDEAPDWLHDLAVDVLSDLDPEVLNKEKTK